MNHKMKSIIVSVAVIIVLAGSGIAQNTATIGVRSGTAMSL